VRGGQIVPVEEHHRVLQAAERPLLTKLRLGRPDRTADVAISLELPVTPARATAAEQ